MSNWKYEVIRSAAQSCYWLNYRYAEDMKLTALDYVNDVMASDEVAGSPFDADVVETPIWHERWYSGHHEKPTGRYVYTTPRPERLDAALEFVAKSGLALPVALADHAGVPEQAEVYARAQGFDCYADQVYFAGRFRGNFITSGVEDRAAFHSVLMVHRVQGEEYFRVREVNVFYERDEEESDADFAARFESMVWDCYTVFDGWAATGTDFGSIFVLNRDGTMKPEFFIDNYRWDTKNNRILGFNASVDGSANAVVRFQLCQNPKQINLSIEVMRSVSEIMRLSHAAQ